MASTGYPLAITKICPPVQRAAKKPEMKKPVRYRLATELSFVGSLKYLFLASIRARTLKNPVFILMFGMQRITKAIMRKYINDMKIAVLIIVVSRLSCISISLVSLAVFNKSLRPIMYLNWGRLIFYINCVFKKTLKLIERMISENKMFAIKN